MIDDLKKSFDQIIYERTTSPFYGSFIISWCLWNWKILYLTFFVSQDKIDSNKIDYIINNFSSTGNVFIFPLLSSIIIITLVPFMTNGAYWLSLKFNKWRVDQKKIVDRKQLLTIEQSIELREQISKQEERFAKLVDDKNLEIKQLNLEIEEYRKKEPTTILNNFINSESENNNSQDELLIFADRVKNNPKELKEYENILFFIQRSLSPVDETDSKFLTLLESYDIISPKQNGHYVVTETGKKFYRLVNS
ncbi:hypothetical protein [Flavobacterium johnsoniae]|uniref:Uncharacterized protein n=1 Tax=Flavobacterium johnsoniae TaxID=986 RepID=A0A1J7BVQ5_FLAJO|nr:hypothetical protein [Flavobacterium johnsoniae]OIV42758.1 hypothetical protein BKM63_07760 [Flavobacterium johnsoniae]